MDPKERSSMEAEKILSLHCTLMDSFGLINSDAITAVLNGKNVFSQLQMNITGVK